MTITDEKLSAYLDGMIQPDDASDIARALLSDESLRTRFNAMKQADKAAASVFGKIDDHPVPEAIENMLQRESGIESPGESGPDAQASVLSLSAFRDRLKIPRNLAALAASIALAFGFGVGIMTDLGKQSGVHDLVVAQNIGVVKPGNPLFEVLQNVPGGETVSTDKTGGTQATVLLSFKTRDGSYCREVETMLGADGQKTLFCKQDEQWRMVASIASSTDAADGYAPASNESLQVIEDIISRTIEGAPLSAKSETEAIRNGW